MDVKMQSITSIRPYPGNPRRNEAAIDKVAASITEFGWRQPIVVDTANVIIIGHTRLLAAQRLKARQVPVHVAKGLSETQVRALRLMDNRSHEDSTWDFERLSEELSQMGEFDMSLTGFTPEELAALLPEAITNTKDPDQPPATPKEVRSSTGDVWLCGEHRVGCADATQAAAVATVTKGELADIVWTDPPYNVEYSGKTAESLTIQNDRQSQTDFLSFLRAAFRVLAGVTKPGAAIYVAHAETEGSNFRRAFLDAGFKLSGVLIWRKDSMVLGRSDYQWQHEPILYGWKEGATHRFYGGRKNTTLLEFGGGPFTQMPDGRWQVLVGDRLFIVEGNATIAEMVPSMLNEVRPKRSLEHPTMKPVELIERMLKNSARTGQLVFDGFGGSGSTLIAAERLAMRAITVELDPRYTDVIVKRWQDFAGRVATRERDGVQFDAVEPRAIAEVAPEPPAPVIRTGLRKPVPIKRAIAREAKRKAKG